MDLKEFVSETLISIISGVTDAQVRAEEIGAKINPSGLNKNYNKGSDNAVWDESNNNYAQTIAFDVAVTAEDNEKAGAKVKVIAGIFGADANAEKGTKNSLVTRVQFSVPVLLPPHDINKPTAKGQGSTSQRLTV
jgi:hypothetical protein